MMWTAAPLLDTPLLRHDSSLSITTTITLQKPHNRQNHSLSHSSRRSHRWCAQCARRVQPGGQVEPAKTGGPKFRCDIQTKRGLTPVSHVQFFYFFSGP